MGQNEIFCWCFDVFLLLVLVCQKDISMHFSFFSQKTAKTHNQLKFCLVCGLIPWEQQSSDFQLLRNAQIPKMTISFLLHIFFSQVILILHPKTIPVCYFSITFLESDENTIIIQSNSMLALKRVLYCWREKTAYMSGTLPYFLFYKL